MQDLQYFTGNLAGAAKRLPWRDSTWLVIPLVAIREGVLNSEFVPKEEISFGVQSWNGRPVTFGHPMQGNRYISANSPRVLDEYQAGMLFNARMDGAKLKADAWLDIAALERTEDGRELLERMNNGRVVEVSTAYFRSVQETEGTFNGVDYSVIAHDLKPDHLAILLNEKGACSWEDGCGLPRTNASKDRQSLLEAAWAALQRLFENKEGIFEPEPEANEESLDSLVERVRAAFYRQAESADPLGEGVDAYVRAVFSDRIIVDNGGRLFAYPYDATSDGVTFGESTEVEIQYIPVESEPETQSSEEDTMKDNQELLANLAEQYETSIATLAGLPDNILDALAANKEPQPCEQYAALIEHADEMGGPEAALQVLKSTRQAEEEAHSGLVAELAANQNCVFTEEELGTWDMAALTKLQKMLKPRNYGGRPAPTTEEQSYELEPME